MRITFNNMVKVGKLQRVSKKENRSVVPNQIPIALVGVKLNGKTSYITFGISCTTFACNRRETDKKVGFLTHFREDTCKTPPYAQVAPA